VKSSINSAARVFAALLIYAVSASTASAAILKKPYLIYEGDSTTMTVVWQDTAVEATNTLSWGTDASYGLGSVTVPDYGDRQHKYKIAGLSPSTRYYYKVADAAGGVYGTGSFMSAPADDARSVKFLGFGDTRSQPVVLEGVMQEMRKVYAADPAFQSINMQAGDWVSSEAESAWTAQWFNANPQTVALMSEQPINGVKGNHDNASGFSRYFPKYYPFPYPAATPKPGDATSFNNLYWSFDYGPIHFTVVDQYSPYIPGSAQYQWLENDLATTTKPWKIVMFHEPAWAAGTHGNNKNTQTHIDPLIKKYGVDLVFSGHNHNYVRCQANDEAEAAGDTIALKVPYVTVGNGGAPLYKVDTTNTGAYRHVVTALSEYGYVTFEVNHATLTMNAYAVTKADGSRLSTSSVAANASTKSTLIEKVRLYHPPSLTAKTDKAVLWPPYHQMVPVVISTEAFDGSAISPVISAVVSSNEPQNGLGDGDTDQDWTTPVVDANGRISLSLRAERGGLSTGRTYTVRVTATGPGGDTTTVPVQVLVPHDM
jgi:predicted phosphodiesterase